MGWFGPLTSHGARDRRTVALTFNGGPNRAATHAVVAELERRNLTATFFVVGAHVRRQPQVVRDVLDAGHEVGVLGMTPAADDWWRPTWDHHEEAQALVLDETGHCARFARPPHGRHTPSMSWSAADASMRPVSYDVEARD